MSSRRAECVFSGLSRDMPMDVMRIVAEYAKLDDRERLVRVLTERGTRYGSGSIYNALHYGLSTITWSNIDGREYEKKYYVATIRYSRYSATHSILGFEDLPDGRHYPESDIDIASCLRKQMAEIE